MDTPRDNVPSVVTGRTRATLDALDELAIARSELQGLMFLMDRAIASAQDREEGGIFEGLSLLLDEINVRLGKTESLL